MAAPKPDLKAQAEKYDFEVLFPKKENRQRRTGGKSSAKTLFATFMQTLQYDL